MERAIALKKKTKIQTGQTQRLDKEEKRSNETEKRTLIKGTQRRVLLNPNNRLFIPTSYSHGRKPNSIKVSPDFASVPWSKANGELGL